MQGFYPRLQNLIDLTILISIFCLVSKKHIYFLVGLAGVFISPFLFDPLSNLIQTHGPAWAATKIARVNHLTFWILSFVWAIYFGIWVWKSDWNWFSLANLKRKLFLIIAVATIMRLAVITLDQAPLSSDAKEYDQLAQALVQTGAFQENGKLTAFRPIGYPVFLAGIYKVFGHSLFLPKLANVLLDIFLLLLLFQIFALWKDEETAFRAMAVVAFYPPTLYTTQNLLSEHLFGFLWFLSIYFWEKSPKYKTFSFLSGLTLGISALVRPVVLAWGIIPIVMSLAKKRWVSLALFLMGAIIATGFWYHRNHKNFEIWTLSTNAGPNFWMGANPKATGHFNRTDSLLFNSPNEGEVERKAWKLGWEYVRNNPWEYFKLGLIKEIVIFGFDYSYLFTTLEQKPPYGQLTWGILGEAFWWILLFFAIVNSVRILFNPDKRRAIDSILPIWTIACWATAHFFFIGVDRFHHPVVPFFAFLAVLTFKPSKKLPFERSL